MSHGHIIDGIRHSLRRPSQSVIAAWPENTYILDTDSGKIRLRDTGGTKPVLLMVPDGPCVIEHFEVLITELLPHFRVVCFDMPGFGFSYPAHAYDFKLESGVKIITSVLDALDIQKATLSFSCVNSYAAIAFAKSFPQRVSRLVLAQAPSLSALKIQWVNRNIPKPLRIPYIGQVANAFVIKKLAANWYDMSLPKQSPDKEKFVEQALLALRSGACFCLASTVQGMVDASEHALNGIDVPTLMVWGNKDWSHKNTNFDSLRDHIPHCEIHKFNECGHFPYLEQPKAFAALLSDAR